LILLYSRKEYSNLTKLDISDIPLISFAQSSKILNIETNYIKERLKNVYVIDSNILVSLLPKTPLPIHVNRHLVLWEEKYAFSTVNISWETLNIIMALSGNSNKIEAYNSMIDKNIKVKQDIMYLSVQLQEISARINEFNKSQVYEYFDQTLFRQILRKKKIRNTISNGKIVINLSNIKIGNDSDGYIVYNKVKLYISKWNVLDGYSLHFNNFSYSSFWNIKDVVLHPTLYTPYYLGLPIIDISYELYIDNMLNIAMGKSKDSIISIPNIIRNYNRYRRIWNSIKDTRLNYKEDEYKDIFII